MIIESYQMIEMCCFGRYLDSNSLTGTIPSEIGIPRILEMLILNAIALVNIMEWF